MESSILQYKDKNIKKRNQANKNKLMLFWVNVVNKIFMKLEITLELNDILLYFSYFGLASFLWKSAL